MDADRDRTDEGSVIRTKVRYPNNILSFTRTRPDKQLKQPDPVQERQHEPVDAFEDLVAHSHQFLIGRLRDMVVNGENVADLSQEILIRTWRHVRNSRSENSFKTWFSQTISDLVRDHVRKHNSLELTISREEPEQLKDRVANRFSERFPVLEALDPIELLELIANCINRVSEPSKTALVLREIENLTYSEISLITNARLGTVKSRVARARRQLSVLLRCAYRARI